MKSRYLPCGREGILSYIDHGLLEDITGLLRQAFTNELVVGFDLWYIASVARDHGTLSGLRTLQAINRYRPKFHLP